MELAHWFFHKRSRSRAAVWQNEVGLRFDHVLPLRRGKKQYRHDAAGSVVKINHHIDPIPSVPPSGYRELIVAQTSRPASLNMVDPDGNAVSVVPPGYHGVQQIGIRMGVRDLDATGTSMPTSSV
jgi:hypothetical protein